MLPRSYQMEVLKRLASLALNLDLLSEQSTLKYLTEYSSHDIMAFAFSIDCNAMIVRQPLFTESHQKLL